MKPYKITDKQLQTIVVMSNQSLLLKYERRASLYNAHDIFQFLSSQTSISLS